MSTLKPIVYGDNGRHGAALKFAVAEAKRRHAPLRVVHCAPTPTEEVLSETLYREVLAAGQTILDSTRAIIEQDEQPAVVEYVLSSGVPASVLVQESRTAQLLVTGIDDIPWYDRLLGSAVAGHLARHTHCPLITVPDSREDGERQEGVIVALDGNSPARPLLTFAFELADLWGCTLYAVRTVPVGTVPDFVESARATLSEVLAGWGETYPDVHVEREVVIGEPSEAFVDATRKAELVVMGRSHRNVLHRPTASSVVRHASCPVAVVPLDDLRA